MSKKIFITRKIPIIAEQKLRDAGCEVDVYAKDRIPSQNEIVSILKKGSYDAVLCLLTDKIDARVFGAARTIKLYANYAVGFDNINLNEAKKRGILVTNAPAEFTAEAVAEHTVALILALSTRIVEADTFVRKGKYKGWMPMGFMGETVFGKTLGLIGVGRIGSRVAHYAKGLGMNIIYLDENKNEQIEAKYGAARLLSVDEVLQKADVVSLHVPLVDSTRHLINKARLEMMKPTACLVNTSRGAVVDEAALIQALNQKIIRAAALDVFEFEPKISSGLRKLQNVILTPHIASASREARDQMAEIAADNIIDFLEGRTPRNLIIN